MTFVKDLVRKDGSYDMVIGQRTGDLKYGTSLRLIKDFVPPRPQSVVELKPVAVTR